MDILARAHYAEVRRSGCGDAWRHTAWECLWRGAEDHHFVAPTWPALVRKVIAADADLVAAVAP